MNQSALQRTLLEVSDRVAQIPAVELLGLEPHHSARDSFVARVQTVGRDAAVELRSVAEQIFQNSGMLVLFQTQV